MTAPIQSPCIMVCSIHQDTGWCHGCGRTVVEIMDWATATPEWRGEIMGELPSRLAQLPKGERRGTRRRAMRDGEA